MNRNRWMAAKQWMSGKEGKADGGADDKFKPMGNNWTYNSYMTKRIRIDIQQVRIYIDV